MRTSSKIAFVGEAMVEMIPNFTSSGFGDAKLGVAGDVLNMGIYLKRSAPQFDVSLVTCLGADALSDRMVEFMHFEGLNTNDISRHPHKSTGLYMVSTGKKGERSFAYWRSHSAARTLFDDGFTTLDQYDVIVFSAITLAILRDETRVAFLGYLEKSRAKIVFDSNYRSKLWESREIAQTRIAQAWQMTDIALPSIDDEFAVFGKASEEDVIKRFQSYGSDICIIKRGEDGPLALWGDQVLNFNFESAANVIDTTAAGDSFAGAFLASYLSGGNVKVAVNAAHKLASKVIGYKGAILPKQEN